MARALRTEYEGEISIWFDCPGCKEKHRIVTGTDKGWGWNGSLDMPTFTPSVKCTTNYGDGTADHICHSFVGEGRIQFLGDCTHALANQTVDLPEVKPF